MSTFKMGKKRQFFAIRRGDRDFALSVSKEYDIPFIFLGINLSFLREICDETFYGDPADGFQGDLPEYVLEEVPFEITRYENDRINLNNLSCSKDLSRECNEKIFSFDARIESITIKSNKGIVTLKHDDPYFHSLTTPIFKIKDDHLLISEKENKELLSSSIEDSLRDIIRFLTKSTSLNKFQIYVVVGMILVHFNLYRGKPLMTKQEFEATPTEAQDYKHYLYDIVKSRLKKIFKDL
jgi:hypothetical protein